MYLDKSNSKSASSRRNVRRPRSKGTTAFYTGFFGFIIVFVIAVVIGMVALHRYLVNFERAQPTAKSKEVFEQYFSNPNWADLYTMSGEKDTTYEGIDAYTAYMQNLVGDQKLNYLETSAGLSGNKKYVVRLDKLKIAEFTLHNKAESEKDIPEWELGEIHLVYTRNEGAFITSMPGHTVYVNGVALDDSFTVSTSTTVAEKYLPQGVHGYQDKTLYIGGLLTKPTVTIKDQSGNPMEVTYDEETKTFTEVMPMEQISEEFKNNIITSSKTYGKYMIGAANKASLRQYFDANGAAYKTIVSIDTWMQGYKDYRFGEPTISAYYRYSDNLYSARVSMILYVTRKDGTVKEYDLDSTYFVEKGSSGKWLITNMTNKDVQERESKVKLTYVVNGETVHSEFVDADTSKITLPSVTAPDGKAFLGWFQKTVDDNGKTKMTLVFAPQKDNIFHISDGTRLTPLILYAQFGKESA